MGKKVDCISSALWAWVVGTILLSDKFGRHMTYGGQKCSKSNT